MSISVWSERLPTPGWDQCTESAYLMALLYGGFRDFPLGAYSNEERNALDNATPPDPATGGSTFDLLDKGAAKRYGVTLHRIPAGDKAGLRAQLSIPHQALAIAGSLGHFPAGHRLRRWQPSYTGGHAICLVTLPDDMLLWLDPLAPMRTEPDRVPIGAGMTFAWYPSDARITRDLAFAGRRLRNRLDAARADVRKAAALASDLAADIADL